MFNLILPGFNNLLSAGYECESIGDCFETDIFGYKSIYLLSNMGILSGGDQLLSSSVDLFEQGNSEISFESRYPTIRMQHFY